MYHLQRNEMYRLGDNAQKSYVVHRRLTLEPYISHLYKFLKHIGALINIGTIV